MRRVDFRPSVIEARIYDRGGYKERTAYLGSFVMHIVNDIAYNTLLTGVCADENKCTWDEEIDTETEAYLLSIGVKQVIYEHKGKQIKRNLG